MLVSDLVRVATVGASAVAAHLHWSALIVYATAILTTVSGTVFRPAEAALLPTVARSPEELTAANVSSSTFDSVGSFVGPALGALLLAARRPGDRLRADRGDVRLERVAGRTHACSVRRPEKVVGDEAERARPPELLAGVRAIRREPRLRLLIGLYGAQTFVAGALVVLVVVTALRLLELGSAGVGILEAASGIGSIVGAGVMLALVGRKRLAEDLAIGLVLWARRWSCSGSSRTPRSRWSPSGSSGSATRWSTCRRSRSCSERPRPRSPVASSASSRACWSAGMALGSLLAPALVGLAGPRGALIVDRWRPSDPRAADAGPAAPDRRRRRRRRGDHRHAPQRAVPGPAPSGHARVPRRQRRSVALARRSRAVQAGDEGDRFYVLTSGTLAIALPEGVKREGARLRRRDRAAARRPEDGDGRRGDGLRALGARARRLPRGRQRPRRQHRRRAGCRLARLGVVPGRPSSHQRRSSFTMATWRRRSISCRHVPCSRESTTAR